MIAGDEWAMGGHSPSPQDWQKYKTQGYRLLLKVDCYLVPVQARVSDISPNGEYIEINGGPYSVPTWHPMMGTKVLDFLDRPQPILPVKPEAQVMATMDNMPPFVTSYIPTTQPKKRKRKAPKK